jgi:hypothetical protein
MMEALKRLFGPVTTWSRFAALFLATFAGGVAALYLFVLLVDPYDLVPFSPPMMRPVVSGNQRHAYPQIVRSRRYDGVIVGTSTGRLLDPDILNGPFGVTFANLAMNDMKAWEQKTLLDYVLRHAGPPKVLILALDRVWCEVKADVERISPLTSFPEWLYDENPWNDYLYLLNSSTLTSAVRIVGYQFGLYRERVRPDGYQVFTPPESQYDPARAKLKIWHGEEPWTAAAYASPAELPAAERQAMRFAALSWLDDALARMPSSSMKVLAFMPVHIRAQPRPGTAAGATEAECRRRIEAIARARGAILIDWRFASSLTTNDDNYWDDLHYRLPVAHRIARDLAAAALQGRESEDGTYRLIAR